MEGLGPADRDHVALLYNAVFSQLPDFEQVEPALAREVVGSLGMLLAGVDDSLLYRMFEVQGLVPGLLRWLESTCQAVDETVYLVANLLASCVWARNWLVRQNVAKKMVVVRVKGCSDEMYCYYLYCLCLYRISHDDLPLYRHSIELGVAILRKGASPKAELNVLDVIESLACEYPMLVDCGVSVGLLADKLDRGTEEVRVGVYRVLDCLLGNDQLEEELEQAVYCLVQAAKT